jgi:aldose 1-epimerase
MNPLSRILLREGPLTVGVAPEHGGSWTRFDARLGSALFEIFRPARDANSTGLWALGASNFPMLPYCGRLREGRFLFNGRAIRYPLNALPERHSSHGDAWTRSWVLTYLDHRKALMSLEDDARAPLHYECTQEVAVSANRVDVCFVIRNASSRWIPIGVGIHPYFASRSLAAVRAHLPRHWELDTELMPVKLLDSPSAPDLLRGQPVAQMPIVSEYAGWDGTASIEWPTLGVKVRLETTPALKHAVLWAPQGEDFFCFEPTSHATDALNARDGHPSGEDFVILKPDAVHKQRFAFIVEAPLMHARYARAGS